MSYTSPKNRKLHDRVARVLWERQGRTWPPIGQSPAGIKALTSAQDRENARLFAAIVADEAGDPEPLAQIRRESAAFVEALYADEADNYDE